MGTFWKRVLVKYVLNEFVLTKDLVFAFEHEEIHVPHEGIGEEWRCVQELKTIKK